MVFGFEPWLIDAPLVQAVNWKGVFVMMRPNDLILLT
jgi:hypothetical protein